MYEEDHHKEVTFNEEDIVVEEFAAQKPVLSSSPWEMDQYQNKFQNYDNLRKYETKRGLQSVLRLFWNRLPVHGEMPMAPFQFIPQFYHLIVVWYILWKQGGHSNLEGDLVRDLVTTANLKDAGLLAPYQSIDALTVKDAIRDLHYSDPPGVKEVIAQVTA
uniref:Uncharacterized protein n=1 Tax=Cannabis sativa TaxID=3483 RepID=A0A803PY09_CANSA